MAEPETAPSLPFHLPSLLKRLVRHWWFLLVLVAGGLALGLPLGFYAGNPVYEADAVLLYNPTNNDLSDEFEVLQKLDDGTTFIYRQGARKERVDTKSVAIQTLLNTVKIPANLQAIRNELKLKTSLDTLGAAISVRVVKETSLMLLKARWDDPETAAALVNTLSRIFIDQNGLINRQYLQETVQRLQVRHQETSARLEQARAEYGRFAKNNPFVDIGKETEKLIEELYQAKARRDDALSQQQVLLVQDKNLGLSIAGLEKQKTDTEQRLKSTVTPDAAAVRIQQLLVQIESNKQEREGMAQLLAKKDELDAAKRLLSEGLVANSEVAKIQGDYDRLQAQVGETDQVRAWKAEIDSLRAIAATPRTGLSPEDTLLQELRLRQFEVQLQKLSTEGSLAVASKQVKTVEDKLNGLPQISQRYAQLKTIIVGLEAELKGYDSLLAQATTAFNNVAADFSVVSKATVPLAPVESSRKSIALIIFAAVVLGGIAFLFLKEFLDPRVLTLGEVRVKIGHPALAEIPKEPPEASLFPDGAESVVFERFRTLGLLLRRAQPRRGVRILVASCYPGEGKSLVAANVAAVFGRQDERVLLIDAHVRKKTTGSFGLLRFRNPGRITGGLLRKAQTLQKERTSEVGLNDYLGFSRTDLADIVQPSRFMGVDLVGAGESDVMPDLLSSHRMGELLEQASEIYSVVLLEASAVLQYVDAAQLARWCDAVLLVVQAGGPGAGSVKKALSLLEINRKPLLGVVLNRVSKRFLED